MRTAILFVGILIADAIGKDKKETWTPMAYKFLAIVMISAMVMDIVDFIHGLSA
jgi:hypothetical protein